MNERGLKILSAITVIALGSSGCTTVYTEADLPELERREEAQLSSEETNDAEIGAEGGTNIDRLREQE